ncbi:hypothetical protein BJX99DRAFT_201435 [Aspergillus californicus]
MSGLKRVILRIPENQMNFQDPAEFVRFYFTKFPSDAGSDPARHFVHYQPPSDFPQSNPKIHIVIDLEIQQFSGPLTKDFPHEVYSLRRGPEQLEIYAYPEATKQNLIQKIREYSDDFYTWARDPDRRDAASA